MVSVATNEEITLQMLGIIVVVALPFAGFSELVVDEDRFEYFDRIAAWLASALTDRE